MRRSRKALLLSGAIVAVWLSARLLFAALPGLEFLVNDCLSFYHYERGRDHQLAGRLVDAEREFAASVQVARRDRVQHSEEKLLVAWQCLSETFEAQGKIPEQIDVLEQAISLQGDGSRFGTGLLTSNLANLGVAYQRQGRYQEADASFERALQLLREQGAPPAGSELYVLRRYESLLGWMGRMEELDRVQQRIEELGGGRRRRNQR